MKLSRLALTFASMAVVSCHATGPDAPGATFPRRQPLTAHGPATPADARALEDPVRRYLTLADPRSDPATVGAIDAAFRDGDLSLLGPWAELVVAGVIRPAKAHDSAPHAVYFAKLVATRAPDRDAFLADLVAARRLHLGLADPISPSVLPCGASCAAHLVDYLAAFPPSGPAPAARGGAFGDVVPDPRVTPDAAIVGVVGDFGLTDAVPALERLVQRPRQFYMKDNGAESVVTGEVGRLYAEAVLALVKVARAHPGEAPAIARFFRAEARRLAGHERIWHSTLGSDPFEVPVARGEPTSKLESLEGAAGVIEARVAPSTLTGVPSAAGGWSRSLDYDEIGGLSQERGQRHAVVDGVLYYLGEDHVGAVDLARGDRLFDEPLVTIGARHIGRGPPGTVVVGPWVGGGSGLPAGTTFYLLLDARSGEVVRMLPWDGDTRTWDLAVTEVADGLLVGAEHDLRKLGWDGTPGWIVPLGEHDGVTKSPLVGGGHAAIRVGTGIQLLDEAGHAGPLASMGTLMGLGDGVWFESPVLGPSAFFVRDGFQHEVHGIDYQGRELWHLPSGKAPQLDVRACGDGACFALDGALNVVPAHGVPLRIEAGGEIIDYAVDAAAVLVSVADAVVRYDRATGATRRIPRDGVRRIFGLTDRCVVVDQSVAGFAPGRLTPTMSFAGFAIGCVPR